MFIANCGKCGKVPNVGIAARILSLRPDLKPFEMKTVLCWLFKSSQLGNA